MLHIYFNKLLPTNQNMASFQIAEIWFNFIHSVATNSVDILALLFSELLLPGPV